MAPRTRCQPVVVSARAYVRAVARVERRDGAWTTIACVACSRPRRPSGEMAAGASMGGCYGRGRAARRAAARVPRARGADASGGKVVAPRLPGPAERAARHERQLL